MNKLEKYADGNCDLKGNEILFLSFNDQELGRFIENKMSFSILIYENYNFEAVIDHYADSYGLLKFNLKGILPRQIQSVVKYLTNTKTLEKLYSEEFIDNQDTHRSYYNLNLKDKYSSQNHFFKIEHYKNENVFEKELFDSLNKIYEWMDEKNLPPYINMLSKGIYSFEINVKE
ncbi:hypothetical protein [Aureivirga sp. CE67]|uniref:hypothetical protein n=1 Tax=Aureivirga sp. CE67 TaxID=1788983 RepID=UPI0018C9B2F8|nr:hypothetical protein [Aureivirga sp. CE67]